MLFMSCPSGKFLVKFTVDMKFDRKTMEAKLCPAHDEDGPCERLTREVSPGQYHGIFCAHKATSAFVDWGFDSRGCTLTVVDSLGATLPVHMVAHVADKAFGLYEAFVSNVDQSLRGTFTGDLLWVQAGGETHTYITNITAV